LRSPKVKARRKACEVLVLALEEVYRAETVGD